VTGGAVTVIVTGAGGEPAPAVEPAGRETIAAMIATARTPNRMSQIVRPFFRGGAVGSVALRVV